MRLVFGHIADRTRTYWTLTFVGYGLIACIPLLAFTTTWPIAAVLIILERLGKATRAPARDAILSHATKLVGRGFGFGIHEALDQVGAIIGPLLFSLVFVLGGSYHAGFTLLWLPAVLVLAVLGLAKRRVPQPEELEMPQKGQSGTEGKLPTVFWVYMLFTFFSGAGFVNFPLISYSLKVRSVVSDIHIPTLFAIAMGVDAVTALAVGKLYDKIGLKALGAVPLLSLIVPLLAFTRAHLLVVASIVVWGMLMGIHETIMRAAVADLTPIDRRGFAYGVFNTAYGASWLIGGVIMGILHDISTGYLTLFAVLMEILSMPLLFTLAEKPQK